VPDGSHIERVNLDVWYSRPLELNQDHGAKDARFLNQNLGVQRTDTVTFDREPPRVPQLVTPRLLHEQYIGQDEHVDLRHRPVSLSPNGGRTFSSVCPPKHSNDRLKSKKINCSDDAISCDNRQSSEAYRGRLKNSDEDGIKKGRCVIGKS